MSEQQIIRIVIEVPVVPGQTGRLLQEAVKAAVEASGAAVIGAQTLGDAAPIFDADEPEGFMQCSPSNRHSVVCRCDGRGIVPTLAGFGGTRPCDCPECGS